MGSLLLLDTSALLTLRDDEPGAGRVEEALEQPGRCYACFLSRMEMLFAPGKTKTSAPVAWPTSTQGPAAALCGGHRALLEQAASIKACHSLSLADAWIAAAAQQVGATLLHKDPEFRTIADLPQEWLG